MPCKRCGYPKYRMIHYSNGHRCSCVKCGYCTKLKATPELAIEAWNQRKQIGVCVTMKCVDCQMYDPVDGCHADNHGEDCDKIEYETTVEMVEYCEMYEPTYNPEDGSM